MITIETILQELENKELWDVLNAVYAYYLTDKERDHYQVLLLYLQGKPQRDLGILLNVQQFKISEYLTKLQIKLKRVSAVLVYQRTILEQLLSYLKKRLTDRQYLIICLLLAGNKRTQVASILNISPASISFRLEHIFQSLPETKRILLTKFINTLG